MDIYKIIEELRKSIINEADIQKQVDEYGGIECSYTGELVPFEIVEGELRKYARQKETR